ncbi:META domain-containing protein [Nocardia stercoris]|uniref:META domain-containing protein n=1 Tax=Nocardia stercoris TaxID=2483361 RepID=A0A3M2KSJ0_9NOCA|nr:META domain-containing protein [Nocardia stercoris]RMI28041.1 META domain-containing protein [Nocardia stercoris]
MAAHLLRWFPLLPTALVAAACSIPTTAAPPPAVGRAVAGQLHASAADPGAPTDPLGNPFGPPGPPAPLLGTPWVVVTVLNARGGDHDPALAQVRPTLTITPGGAVFGNAGCNRLTGDARIDPVGPAEDHTARIVFRTATTSRWCGSAVLALEEEVLRALRGPVEAVTGPGTLTLRNLAEHTGLTLRAE